MTSSMTFSASYKTSNNFHQDIYCYNIRKEIFTNFYEDFTLIAGTIRTSNINNCKENLQHFTMLNTNTSVLEDRVMSP